MEYKIQMCAIKYIIRVFFQNVKDFVSPLKILLIGEHMTSLHHSFDIAIATKYGIQEALVIHHFQHWITINKRLQRNYHEGSYWSYQTLDEMAAHFPYLSKHELFEIIERLCNGKGRRSKKEDLLYEPVLKKSNFNQTKYDRTTWYAFIDEPKWILAQAKMDIGASQNGDWHEPTPIPDSIPDTKTKELTDSQTVISICPYKKEFIGITLDDMKEWRSKYHSLNLDKELKMIAEKCYGKTITCLKNYINQTLHNIQEKRLFEARPRRQEPSLQVPAPADATNDDYESNTKIAKYIAALADKENINYNYKIEFTHQGLRFNKPSSSGCVDLSLHQPSLQFRQSCKMHLSKLAMHHPSFNEVIQRL